MTIWQGDEHDCDRDGCGLNASVWHRRANEPDMFGPPRHDHPRQKDEGEQDAELVQHLNREHWTPARIEADAWRMIAAATAAATFLLSGCTGSHDPHSALSWVALVCAVGAVLFVEFSGHNRPGPPEKFSGVSGPEVADWPTPDQAAELETRLVGPATSCMVIGSPVSRQADGSFRPVSCGYGDLRGPIGRVENVRQIDGRIFADIVPTQGFVDELRGVVLAEEGEYPPAPRLATVIFLDAYRGGPTPRSLHPDCTDLNCPDRGVEHGHSTAVPPRPFLTPKPDGAA